MRTETFDTPGSVELDIRLGSGEIRIDATDVKQTTVELRPLRDNDATLKAIENARVELRGGTDRQGVIVDLGRSRSGLFRGASVGIEITCPEGADAEVKSGSAGVDVRGLLGSIGASTGSGDIELSDLSGDAKINTASGDLRMGNVGGEARINTASGDVQAKEISGDARFNTASGDVIVKSVSGSLSVNSASGDVIVKEAQGPASVNVNTASGDQTIGSLSEGSAELKSASGDITVGIKEGSTLWVDARSRSGEVRSELPVSESVPEGGGPHVELKASTMSGDIEITRA
jgi:DUF4097 and DUF4098 domain-containing protein YvlB